MKSRPASDPTSWDYQANMHWTLPFDDSIPLWNGCEHGTIHFLTWHRGYLHFFERILRAASGDPTLSLPYWNWSEQLQLPDPFRVSNSPLYDSTRLLNGGGALRPENTVDDVRTALEDVAFYDPFGLSGGFSLLHEGSPHGAVHVQVGGNMGAVPTSARDPIFWLHHANIDRIWDMWLNMGGGRANPIDPVFLDHTFSYADETGAQRDVAVREIIHSRTLNYRYDDVPNPPQASAMRSMVVTGPGAPHAAHAEAVANEPVVVAAPGLPAPANPPGEAAPAAAMDQSQKPLGLQPERIALTPVADRAETLRSATAQPTPGRLFVEVQGIQLEQSPNLTYGVYLNLPEGVVDPGQARAHYLGSLHLFGKGAQAEAAHAAAHAANHHAVRKVNDFDQAFDASRAIERLRRENRWQEDSFSVTILPLTSAANAEGQAAPAAVAESVQAAQVTYRSAVIKATP